MREKHGSNNLEDHRRIFEAALYDLEQRGFLLSVNLTFTPIPGGLDIRGCLECPGNVFIKVAKILEICGGDDDDPLVRTQTYTYNAFVNGVGNIVRYDGPDVFHEHYHVHRYDLFVNSLRQRLYPGTAWVYSRTPTLSIRIAVFIGDVSA